ncbi:MAG: hypothetical protein QM608_01675 [Caulobacter sp.]
MARTRSWLRFRRFVDRKLAKPRAAAPLPVCLLVLAMAFLGPHLTPPVALAGWIIVAAASLVWVAFVVWRGSRLFRASSLRGDRAFDQRGKFRLSPEYWRSESASRARRRKR